MKRMISIFLTLLLVAGLPLAALAEGGDESGSGKGSDGFGVDTASVEEGGVIAPTDTITLTFTNNVVNAKVKEANAALIELTDALGNPVEIDVVMADDQIEPDLKRVIEVVPKNPLAPGEYTLTAKAGITAKNGTAMEKDFVLNFSVAEGEPVFTFGNGITFGMSQEEVIAAETGRYEIDYERTRGPVDFVEVEYERATVENIPAEVKYLFAEDQLAAIRVNFETRDVSLFEVRAYLTATYGPEGPVDLTLLGNGVYAVDDDGRLKRNAVAYVTGNVMLILEPDGDDIDITAVDLTAGYINAQ